MPEQLSRIANPCRDCGHPLGQSALEVCSRCAQRRHSPPDTSPEYDRLTALYPLTAEQKQRLNAVKYSGGLAGLWHRLTKLPRLTRMIDPAAEELEEIHRLISIPGLLPRRLAGRLSELTGIPMFELETARAGLKHAPLSRRARQGLAAQARYTLPEGYRGYHGQVALIDDVYTTGATLRTAARQLKRELRAACYIHAVTLYRTPRK